MQLVIGRIPETLAPILACLLGVASLSAQTLTKPQPGSLLIANRTLRDPNFYQSVILILDYSPKGALGLIINDPTKVPLAKLFEQNHDAQSRSDFAYLGGPVQRSVVHILMRSKEKPEGANSLAGDAYFASSKIVIDKALANAMPPESMRVFLGYSGWGAGQLDAELEIGSWSILRTDMDAVFDAKPEALWERLIRRTELRMAGVREKVTRRCCRW